MSDIGKINIRIVEFERVQPMPDNPRIIDDVNLRGLRASLDRFGYVEPIVWNENTGHIVGGHQRFKVLVSQGLKNAPMVVVNLSKDDEMSANLTLNNPEIEGEFTPGTLQLLQSVQGADKELFGSLRLDDLTNTLAKRFRAGGDREFANQEIDVDGLVKNCDAKCPCCGFVWESSNKDMVDLEKLNV